MTRARIVYRAVRGKTILFVQNVLITSVIMGRRNNIILFRSRCSGARVSTTRTKFKTQFYYKLWIAPIYVLICTAEFYTFTSTAPFSTLVFLNFQNVYLFKKRKRQKLSISVDNRRWWTVRRYAFRPIRIIVCLFLLR